VAACREAAPGAVTGEKYFLPSVLFNMVAAVLPLVTLLAN